MSLNILDDNLWFPPASESTAEGLLAIGGDLSSERLLLAYRNGIFPWYDGDVPLWWCPDPRFVLFPDQLIVSKSMKQLLRRNRFHFTINQAFEKVIQQCKTVKRKGLPGTWITPEVKHAFTRLHQLGYAHSAEAWLNGKLVGGLYGVKINQVFFGESMFSLENNASKYAFIRYVEQLSAEGISLIDCQVYTEHLESLGACMLGREKFLSLLEINNKNQDQNSTPAYPVIK